MSTPTPVFILIIWLVGKIEMPAMKAYAFIKDYFPGNESLSFECIPAEGKVIICSEEQEDLSTEQLAWLRNDPFAARYVDSHEVIKPEKDVFHIIFADVEQVAMRWTRVALRVPDFCVVILDGGALDHTLIRQFEDNPLGYQKACRYAVRLADEDVESSKTVSEIEKEYDKELGA